MKSVLGSLSVVFVLMSGGVWAHEGHNATPGSVAAPHGGIIQGTKSLYLELVSEATGVKIYPLTHDVKSIALNDVKISGTYQFPKKKKISVNWKASADHFSAEINAQGAYRYTLEVSVSYKGKSEKVKFEVEPQY